MGQWGGGAGAAVGVGGEVVERGGTVAGEGGCVHGARVAMSRSARALIVAALLGCRDIEANRSSTAAAGPTMSSVVIAG